MFHFALENSRAILYSGDRPALRPAGVAQPGRGLSRAPLWGTVKVMGLALTFTSLASFLPKKRKNSVAAESKTSSYIYP